MTSRPTDDELSDIWHGAVDDSTAHLTVAYAEARRALYEAGWVDGAAREAHECAEDHESTGCKWTNDLRERVDWLLTDEAVDFWNDLTKDWYKPRNVLKELHAKITGGEQ